MIYLLSIAGIITRILPHPPNFTAVQAVGLFSGGYGTKRWFWLVPLITMFISDLMIGFYTWQVMMSVYISFLFTSFLGYWFVRKKRTMAPILGLTIGASIMFYLITNFAVWAWTPIYPKNLAGLLESYIMALPFFRNSILGDLIYTSILFGVYELYKNLQLSLRGSRRLTWQS